MDFVKHIVKIFERLLHGGLIFIFFAHLVKEISDVVCLLLQDLHILLEVDNRLLILIREEELSTPQVLLAAVKVLLSGSIDLGGVLTVQVI